MEPLHVRAADAQTHALQATLGHYRLKSEDATPRKMLRTLKRVATASITCFETHKQLSSHQTFLLKKLSLKAYTKEDISEIRHVCENLVYIIQLPHDRGTYTTALRLLSTIAAAPDPIAFLLLERHIHPILRNVLEVSPHLPPQGSTALLLLLEHLSTRHQLSIARHTLFGLTGRETIDAHQLDAAEKACYDLVKLAEASHSEMWVRMMVQDLLALVAKHPKLGFVLLQEGLYSRVYRIANHNTDGAAPSKLSRRLARLATEGSPEMASMRREMTIMLSKSSFTPEEAVKCRDVLSALLHAVLDGSPESQLTPPTRLLEDVARSKSPASRMLTEEDFYAAIEELWARGNTSVDTLYQLVKGLLDERLVAARKQVEASGLLSSIPASTADELLETFQDLLIICRNHEVYDEGTVETAVEILLLAATASENLSLLLMDPTLIDQYAEIWNGHSGAPRSRRVSHLLIVIRRHQTRIELQNADTLISRLKHTREWSGLDSDNIKPLVQTLLSCAADPELHHLHVTAINALFELAKSPADCAAALLFPEFSRTLKVATEASEIDEEGVLASKGLLKRAITALRVEIQVQDRLPRITTLSEMTLVTAPEMAGELEKLVRGLLRLCREELASENEVLISTLIKALLVVGTGGVVGREILSTAGGYSLLSSSKFTTKNSHQSSFVNALQDFMHDTEATIDSLMQLSELQFDDERRLHTVTHRLVQICRLDLTPWSTMRAIELLGSLTKRSEAVFVDALRNEEISGPLRRLGNHEQARIALPIGRILRTLYSA